jgi:hypothetical protein
MNLRVVSHKGWEGSLAANDQAVITSTVAHFNLHVRLRLRDWRTFIAQPCIRT